LGALTDQLLSVAQSLVREAGGLISSFAASTVVGLGWGFFVLIVSYFLLAETGQVSANLVNIDLPGYDADIRRLSSELGRIWGAFLRGQLILSALAVITYTVMLSALGTRFALVIALMAAPRVLSLYWHLPHLDSYRVGGVFSKQQLLQPEFCTCWAGAGCLSDRRPDF
jgi:predicted PurR-regulated permease PerM